MTDPNEKKPPETYDETDTLEIDAASFSEQINKYRELLDDARQVDETPDEKTDQPYLFSQWQRVGLIDKVVR
ncbi:MAG: hypothetical protein AAFU54_00005 [Chloroflexota bacterium]